jgi:hypothetical protein
MFKFGNTTRADRLETFSPDKNTSSSQVAIYNEDDLSHLLFLETAEHGGHIMINKVEHSEPETPVESPLITDSHGLSSDDDSAILSDCEEESDLEISPSPTRRRGGTMSACDDDFSFPVFLGRQEEADRHEEAKVAPTTPIRPILRRGGPATMIKKQQEQQQHSIMAETNKHVQFVAPQRHVASIEGPLMSWWPAETEGVEYDWVEETSRIGTSMKQRVAEIEGPLMSWWPASTETLQYEWNERFYE